MWPAKSILDRITGGIFASEHPFHHRARLHHCRRRRAPEALPDLPQAQVYRFRIQALSRLQLTPFAEEVQKIMELFAILLFPICVLYFVMKMSK